EYAEDGINLLLPQLDRGRTLARLALLRARVRFDSNRPADGAADALAALALARHLGRDKTMLGCLVQVAIEQDAIGLVASRLPALDPATRKSLAARLGKVPAGAGLAEIIKTEKRTTVTWVLAQVEKVKDEKEAVWKDRI